MLTEIDPKKVEEVDVPKLCMGCHEERSHQARIDAKLTDISEKVLALAENVGAVPRRERATPVNTCAYITDWTLDDNGNRKTAEVCGAHAEWVHDAGVLACSEHYHEHTFGDRARFSYIDEANAPPMFCEFEACDQEPAPGSTLCAGHIEENAREAVRSSRDGDG